MVISRRKSSKINVKVVKMKVKLKVAKNRNLPSEF